MFTAKALRKALDQFKDEDRIAIHSSSRMIETPLGMAPAEIKLKGSRIEILLRINGGVVEILKTKHEVVDEGL